MATLSLEELYSKYIKPRPKADRIKIVEMTKRDLGVPSSDSEEKPTRNIMDLHGLGAEIWHGVDAQEYVNGLRREWNDRP